MVESELVSEVLVDDCGTALTGIRIWNDKHTLMPIKEQFFSRKFFRVDDLVLKFNIEGGDSNQSKNEARLCTEIWPEDYKYFAEIRSTGVVTDKNGRRWRWVSQLYVPEIADPPKDLPAEVISKAEKKVNELRERYNIDDLHREYPRNWTIVGTDPLIYDYGMISKFRGDE